MGTGMIRPIRWICSTILHRSARGDGSGKGERGTGGQGKRRMTPAAVDPPSEEEIGRLFGVVLSELRTLRLTDARRLDHQAQARETSDVWSREPRSSPRKTDRRWMTSRMTCTEIESKPKLDAGTQSVFFPEEAQG
jgi:hypothetical protein